MKVALIGYGKMGKTIHNLLKKQNVDVSVIVDKDNANELQKINNKNTDVAIEFSTPDAAFENIVTCLNKRVPIVSGTTAWLDHIDEVKRICIEKEGAFFYAPNYSIGVNLFFYMNEQLSKLMDKFPSYNVKMEEIHHVEKLDAPSGTAIAAANQILENIDRKIRWSLDSGNANELVISAKRLADVKGTHIVTYENEVDKIELSHVAYSRDGFALGAINVAKWIIGKKGVFEMKDFLRELLNDKK